VEAVAGGVAVGEDKGVLGAVPVVGEKGRVVQDLVEDGDGVNGECGGAGAVVVVLAIGVGHMRFVVRGVEVFAVPAWVGVSFLCLRRIYSEKLTAGEEYLGTETAGAWVVGDLVRLGLVGSQAVEGYALGG